ncbi:hypothetical protein HMPREF1584_00903 [Gardnerella vaginalis JCP8481A]|uniref:Uncharacterized protein n=1 Tax=Gardnerella vaginalis TaxID=2702 RepID=A0A133P393_GARVA|nr:hypothetical protein HMPREF1584_00903 [Gardnerella vaginalis JCP8481A]EPI42880.1 hypothetical protein HMPREF1585_00651 [Gardnerella vaginalis JCP8481B]KXA22980.1 hypothetical protein HMPREF3208_00067 [Gardnerella vaginalis]
MSLLFTQLCSGVENTKSTLSEHAEQLFCCLFLQLILDCHLILFITLFCN